MVSQQLHGVDSLAHVVSTRDCDGQARLRHVEVVPLRQLSQRLLNVLRFVSNLQKPAPLVELVPCIDNAIIADEDKRDLQLLSCLARRPLQLVRHIRVDVQDGNRCLEKTLAPLRFKDQFREFASFHFSHVTLQEDSPDISGEEMYAIRVTRAWRARDKNCPLRHFVASGAATVLQPFVGRERSILLTDP